MSGFHEQVDLLNYHNCGELLKAFAKWCQVNWRHDTKEQWKHDEPWPGDDFEMGFNRAIDGLDMALSCYLEEYLP